MADIAPEDRQRWNTGDFVAAVIDHPADLESFLDELEAAGLDRRGTRVFSGGAGSAEIGQIGGEGLKGRMQRVMADYVGSAKEFTDRHKEEAARGHSVIIVPLTTPREIELIRQTLEAHPAHDIVAHLGGAYISW